LVHDPLTVVALLLAIVVGVILERYCRPTPKKTPKGLQPTAEVSQEELDRARERLRLSGLPLLTPEQQGQERAQVLAMDFGRSDFGRSDPRGIPRIPGGRSSATGGVIRLPPGGHVTFDGGTFTNTAVVQTPLSDGDKAKLAEPVDKPSVWDRLRDDDP
jgi:hypothetical protein